MKYIDYINYVEIKQIITIKETEKFNTKEKQIITIKEKVYDKNSSKINVKREIVFLIRPDIQDDIYYLYCLNDELKEEQSGIAHIKDYNASVMMNKLFRIIKENNNLDALEESDDEDEFENDNIDKFVHLNKSYKMICQFNHKFKKWYPIKLANENADIIQLNELKDTLQNVENRLLEFKTNNKILSVGEEGKVVMAKLYKLEDQKVIEHRLMLCLFQISSKPHSSQLGKDFLT